MTNGETGARPGTSDTRLWIPRGAWRVLVANQAQRIENDLASLGEMSDAQASMIVDDLARARNAAETQKGLARLRDWWSGGRPETAWTALHEAGERLLGLQSSEAVWAQIPEIAAAVTSSLKPDDPRATKYTEKLAEYEKGASNALSPADIAAIARIRRTADAVSDTAHGNVRSYRNLLLLLGFGLAFVLTALALIHAFVPEFLSLNAGSTQDAPEVWAIEVVGGFGGAIAAVLALAKLGSFSGPYNLTVYQALLRVPMASAVSLFAVVLLESNALAALKPVGGLELYAYAILFGYAQEPLLRMIDRQAATMLEPARSKDDPTAPASKPVAQ